jgi:hypothetical protein
MQPQQPMLVPTQHHPLTMPHAVPTVPMPQPYISVPTVNNMAANLVPTVTNMAANLQEKKPDGKQQMSIEMTTIVPPHLTASTMNNLHQPFRSLNLPLHFPHPGDSEDRGKLAEMQIANARRRHRAAMEAQAEQERRQDDPNIFNNSVYEPNTKTLVVHERRTKLHQRKRESDQP